MKVYIGNGNINDFLNILITFKGNAILNSLN